MNQKYCSIEIVKSTYNSAFREELKISKGNHFSPLFYSKYTCSNEEKKALHKKKRSVHE